MFSDLANQGCLRFSLAERDSGQAPVLEFGKTLGFADIWKSRSTHINFVGKQTDFITLPKLFKKTI